MWCRRHRYYATSTKAELSVRLQGKITDWQDERGFGFITISDRRERIFVHVNAFAAGGRRPQLHDAVSFVQGKDKSGRTCANRVKLMPVGKGAARRARGRDGLLRPLLASGFLGAVGIAFLLGELPLAVTAVYVFLSVMTLLFYAGDKRAAVESRWRTPENTLHTLALLGGWPGALFAQRFLRHKSRKTSFLVTFWITVAINLAVLGWLLFSVDGNWWLHELDARSTQLLGELAQQLQLISQ